MITKESRYFCRCDICKQLLLQEIPYGHLQHFDTLQDVKNTMKKEGWVKTDNKIYCDSCNRVEQSVKEFIMAGCRNN